MVPLDRLLNADYQQAASLDDTPISLNSFHDIIDFWSNRFRYIRENSQSIRELMEKELPTIRKAVGPKEYAFDAPQPTPGLFTLFDSDSVVSGFKTQKHTYIFVSPRDHDTWKKKVQCHFIVLDMPTLTIALAFIMALNLHSELNPKELTEAGEQISKLYRKDNTVPSVINFCQEYEYVLQQYSKIERKSVQPQPIQTITPQDETNFLLEQKPHDFVKTLGNINTFHSVLALTAYRRTNPTFCFIYNDDDADWLRIRIKDVDKSPITFLLAFPEHATCAYINSTHMIYVNTGATFNEETSIIAVLKEKAVRRKHIVLQENIQRDYGSCLMWATFLPLILLTENVPAVAARLQSNENISHFTAVMTQVMGHIVKTIELNRPDGPMSSSHWSDASQKAIAQRVQEGLPLLINAFWGA